MAACTQPDSTWKHTDTGYKYQLFSASEGETPTPGNYVFVDATLVVEDSVFFDSRAGGQPMPIGIPPESAPRGDMSPVLDMLALMSEGDSAILVIPVDSFQAPPPSVAPYNEVMYTLRVGDIMTQEEYAGWMKEQRAAQAEKTKAAKAREQEISTFVEDIHARYQSGALEAEIQRTGSGLGYIIHEGGTQGTKPEQGQMVEAHYYGILAETGEKFDSSFSRGSTFSFPLGRGQVIQGWDEGFALLNEGARATLFVPADLGYGGRGSPPQIPPNSDLIFYVEFVGAK